MTRTKLLTPWFKCSGCFRTCDVGSGLIIVDIYTSVRFDLVGIYFSEASGIDDIKYGCSRATAGDALQYTKSVLEKHGYEFVSQERIERLEVLL